MSVAIKCKIVMRLELSLGRWQGFDKGDGGRQRLGGGVTWPQAWSGNNA